MKKGFLNMVLHAHLPFVRHPEYDDSFEERWLYEAITETYIPLLLAYEELINKNVYFRVTMSLTPPLMEMLADELLQYRYIRHMENLIELIEKEKFRNRNNQDFLNTTLMYERKFHTSLDFFQRRCKNNLITAFKQIKDMGFLEIITCCATHGFLPIMASHESSVQAQISIAVNNYRKHLHSNPNGIWLAECGYYPGADHFLRENGIKFFFADSHALMQAQPPPKYAIYSPILCPDTYTAVFARDPHSSKQVWSSHEGYPGDFDYREFYRDAGYDLDFDYIAPYIHESGIRINTGVKYHKITGKTDNKQPYNEYNALNKTKIHARHFIESRYEQCEYLSQAMDRPPVITCPYDAELYGHWWYEGPDFIKNLFEENHNLNYPLQPVTAHEYLSMYHDNPVATPCLSSWGHNGYSEFWLNDSNDWIYMHLHKAQERMEEIAEHFIDNRDPLRERALNQAVRELLLAQSSDWAFIIRSNTCVEYAEKRTNDHLLNFTLLYEQILEEQINTDFLEDIEYRNNIFQEVNFREYT